MGKNLVNLWQVASEELGFKITYPFEMNVDEETTVKAVLLVHDFGAEKGMLVFDDYKLIENFAGAIVSMGYGYTVFSEPDPDEKYNRNDYIGLLNDWTWSGNSEKRPQWAKEAVSEKQSQT